MPECRAASPSAVSLNDQSSKSLCPVITVFVFLIAQMPECRAASPSAVSLNDQSSKSLRPVITVLIFEVLKCLSAELQARVP